MNFVPMGRLLRMLRLRRDWTQRAVAARGRVSAATVGRHENGRIGSIDALERHAAVFGLRVEVRLAGRAGELARITDEEHAAIVEAVAATLRAAGFVVEPEVSFNEWGERGRMDLLAYHPETGTLVIVEVKTQLLDLQDLFGNLDTKVRLAGAVAERLGWAVRRRVTLLVVADTSHNRQVVRRHPAQFGRFASRDLARVPLAEDGARLLSWMTHERASRPAWLAGRQRIRRRRRVAGAPRRSERRPRQLSPPEAAHASGPADPRQLSPPEAAHPSGPADPRQLSPPEASHPSPPADPRQLSPNES